MDGRLIQVPRTIRSIPPELLIVAAAVSVQGGGAFAAQLLQDHSPLAVVSLRIGFSALMLVMVQRPRRGSVGRTAWRDAALLGLVMAAMNTCFYFAIARIPLGVAVTIEFWGPLAVAVVGSRRPRDLAWVGLAAIGIYLLTGGRLVADDLAGVAGAFAAGGCWSVFIVLGGRVSRAWPDGRGLTVMMVAATLAVVPAAAVSGGFAGMFVPSVLAAGLLVATLSSTIPYTLELAAMRHIPSPTYGVLMSLEPAVAALAGFVILGQMLRPVDLLGMVCVGLASAGASASARRREIAPGELEAA